MHLFIPEGKSFGSLEENLRPWSTGSLLERVAENTLKIFFEREDLEDFLTLADIGG